MLNEYINFFSHRLSWHPESHVSPQTESQYKESGRKRPRLQSHSQQSLLFLCHVILISAFSVTADILGFLTRLYPAASLCATCHIVFPALFRYNKQTTDGDILNPFTVFTTASCFHNISGGFRHIFPFV
jgi:hypothetical protein